MNTRRAVRPARLVHLPQAPAGRRRRPTTSRQNVWLQLVGQLDAIRDPAALAGWLATAAQRECWAGPARSAQTREPPGMGWTLGTSRAGGAGSPSMNCRWPSATQRSLREAFTHLAPGCQQLIVMFVNDPPPCPTPKIDGRLTCGQSIGPSRSRLLDKLRRLAGPYACGGAAGPPRTEPHVFQGGPKTSD